MKKYLEEHNRRTQAYLAEIKLAQWLRENFNDDIIIY